MIWLIDWQALSARIKGLLEAGLFFYNALHNSSEDSRSVKKKILLENAEKIFNNLKKFSEKYRAVLPEHAVECLNGFLNKPEFKENSFFNPGRNWEPGNVQFALTSLAAFQSEFNYIIADTQIIARRITERAFIHLQRSIAVDEEVRKKWIDAYNTLETKCEKLGALHLLSHGVWAFKADATKGKTDLILNEPLPPISVIEGAADALVLTEWKLVKSTRELEEKIQEAQKQTEIYNFGILAGVELRNYRYLVMVSEMRMEMPNNTIKGSTEYIHINIAVNPELPSKGARR